MGYDLMPRNKSLEGFHFGAFGWPWMLDQGVGLVVGYAQGRVPGTFLYTPDARDKQGRNLMYNDGAYVTADAARAMARAARALASAYRAINREWDELTEEQRRIQEPMKDTYRRPVREDWLDSIERFAQWAEQSQGFHVY